MLVERKTFSRPILCFLKSTTIPILFPTHLRFSATKSNASLKSDFSPIRRQRYKNIFRLLSFSPKKQMNFIVFLQNGHRKG